MNEHFSYFFALTHIATSFPTSEKHKNYKRQSEQKGIERNIFQNIMILIEVPKSLTTLSEKPHLDQKKVSVIETVTVVKCMQKLIKICKN